MIFIINTLPIYTSDMVDCVQKSARLKYMQTNTALKNFNVEKVCTLKNDMQTNTALTKKKCMGF